MAMIAREQAHGVELATREEEWEIVHGLRSEELFKNLPDVEYKKDHPHDRKSGNLVFVLYVHGCIVGTVRLDFWGNGRAIVRLFAIKKSEQRKGYGRRMMWELEALACRASITNFFLNAHQDTVGFYQRLGFTQEYWEDPNGPRESGITKDSVPMTKVVVKR
jgi:GNAT superfamily N-acetyltransferase